jgi:hypothetical protein
LNQQRRRPAAPEIVPVKFPVEAKKTGLPERSAGTGMIVSVKVSVPVPLLNRSVPLVPLHKTDVQQAPIPEAKYARGDLPRGIKLVGVGARARRRGRRKFGR